MANYTKDQRIIKDNPDATPYELLELGLSEKKYDELMQSAGQSVKDVEIIDAEPLPPPRVKATITEQPARAIPTITVAVKANVDTGMAYLINTQSGKRTYMTFNSATRAATKNPKKYKVEN